MDEKVYYFCSTCFSQDFYKQQRIDFSDVFICDFLLFVCKISVLATKQSKRGTENPFPFC